ncbi:MAG: hypothetical protein J7559_19880, partial [Cohnella sp.]|nr:hypothetical protein [Cohnella sp.]
AIFGPEFPTSADTNIKFTDQDNLAPHQSKLQILYDSELYDYFLSTDVIKHPIAIPTRDKLDVFLKQVTYSQPEVNNASD